MLCHRPIYSRASFDRPYANIGLAINPPKPVLNLEPKRLRGLDVPAPKPVRNLLREFAVFWAQLNALTERVSAVTAPTVAVILRLESMYREEKARLVPLPRAHGREST